MMKNMKLKMAAKRVERKTNRRGTSKKTGRVVAIRNRVVQYATRAWGACRRGARRVWDWVRGLDMVALVNITMLVAIIVLFSMLIIDIMNCRRGAHNVDTPATPQIVDTRTVRNRPARPTLPMKMDQDARVMINAPVNVVPVRKCDVKMARRQTARIDETIYGDTVIDSRGAATIIKSNTNVRGNLYLQNMRKYTLPCGVRVDGNLFLRDVNMLQFCGEFTVTGNIYVSPRSSFGPIPANARVGGNVIL